MTRAVPKEEREKIVEAYEKGLGTVSELAEIFNISSRSVLNYLRQYRETGDLKPKKQPGRPAIITEAMLKIIKKIVLTNTDGTLEHYRNEFHKETGIDVTFVSIHYACKALNLNRKKRVSLLQSKSVMMFKKNEKII